MRLDPPPGCPGICDCEQGADPLGTPASIPSDPVGESDLAIEWSKCPLDIGHDGFDFDDQQGGGRWVPSQHIDRAALGPDRECDLGRRLPARPSELDERAVNQSRMVSVEEAVCGLGVPVDTHKQPRAERHDDRGERSPGEAICAAPLDPGDQRLRDAGASREI